MQDVHDFLDKALGSCGVFHLKLVSNQVEPVFDLLFISVTFVMNVEKYLDSLKEVLPSFIDLADGSSE